MNTEDRTARLHYCVYWDPRLDVLQSKVVFATDYGDAARRFFEGVPATSIIAGEAVLEVYITTPANGEPHLRVRGED